MPPLPPRDGRRPTAADRFLATHYTNKGPYFVGRSECAELQAKCRMAERYVFDEEGAAAVGRWLKNHPDRVVPEARMVTPPYALTWIEFPHWSYWNEIADADALERNVDASRNTADHTVCYLCDGNVVSVITAGTMKDPMGAVEVFPVQYRLRTPWSDAARVEFCRLALVPPERLDAYLWGSSYAHIDAAAAHEFRTAHSLTLLPMLPSVVEALHRGLLPGGYKRNLLTGAAGELRSIVAFLALLNRPHVTQFSSQPRERKFVRGKLLPLHSHTVVRVNLDAAITTRAASEPSGEVGPQRRWHPVQGFFRHNQSFHDGTLAGCEHDMRPTRRDWTPWPEAPLGPEVHRWWQCSHCDGKAVRVRQHHRGSKALGIIDHDQHKVS